ncbi:MAG: BRCT domain-containing protein [Planctomycetota bacterium]
MAKGSGTTVYLVGLIFSILVSMGLLYVCYTLNEELAKKDSKISDAERKHKAEVDRVKELTKELKDSRELITGEPDRVVKKQHYDDTILAEAHKRLQEILSEEWIATEDWKRIKDPQIRDVWQKMTEFRGKPREFKSLVKLNAELLEQLRAVVHIIPVLRYERIAAIEREDTLKNDIAQLRTSKQKEIDDLRADISRKEEEALRLARNFDQERKRLQDEKENILKEVTQRNKDHALEVARLESQKGQLTERIKQLVKKKTKSFTEYSDPDGRVVFADPALGYAWINIGNKHGLRRNLRFQVYQFIKGGRQRVKGVVEVRKIEEDMAQCAILEDQEVTDPITGKKVIVPDKNDPVVKGDLIRNPYFDKEEQKTFVFLGTRLHNRFYNMAEIKRKIEEAGGKVESKVSTGTHFVVVLGEGGDDFQQQYDLATQFGVIFMREDELMEYLGRR